MHYSEAIVQILDQLNETISKKELVTYKDLTSSLGYGRRHPHISNSLDIILRRDHANNRPHRSAAVVRMDTGFPGIGYFIVCKELGYVKDLDDKNELIAFWKTQLKDLGIKTPNQFNEF